MAEMERLDHSGICVVSTRETEDFYLRVFGVPIGRINPSTDGTLRGGSIITDSNVGGFGLALCLPRDRMPMPPAEQLRGGHEGFRHGFAVSRTRFREVVERLRANDVRFEGPVSHPENGPLGESVYFKDPAGNFFEICWRRDRDRAPSK